MGGLEPARSLVLEAIAAGKPVVTANKELLANAGKELFDAAGDAGLDLAFEAAVAGGIPLIRPLKESLAGERIGRIIGIVNGTTNYVLTQMSEQGSSSTTRSPTPSAWATRRPTRPPTSRAPTRPPSARSSPRSRSTPASWPATSTARASPGSRRRTSPTPPRLGYVVKLLAIAELEDEAVSARVHPAMIPATHPLASVRDAFNAVFVEGAKVGELMFYGPRRRRRPHGDRRRGRPDRRRPQPRHRRSLDRLHVLARSPDPADGRHARAVLPEPARRGSPRCARGDRRALRAATTSRSSASGRRAPATRRPSCSSPTGHRRAPSRRRWRSCARWTSVRAVASLLRVEGEEG